MCSQSPMPTCLGAKGCKPWRKARPNHDTVEKRFSCFSFLLLARPNGIKRRSGARSNIAFATSSAHSEPVDTTSVKARTIDSRFIFLLCEITCVQTDGVFLRFLCNEERAAVQTKRDVSSHRRQLMSIACNNLEHYV